MNFEDRIEKSEINMEYVDLVDDESESGYEGAGAAIVFVDAEENKIVEILYIRISKRVARARSANMR